MSIGNFSSEFEGRVSAREVSIYLQILLIFQSKIRNMKSVWTSLGMNALWHSPGSNHLWESSAVKKDLTKGDTLWYN